MIDITFYNETTGQITSTQKILSSTFEDLKDSPEPYLLGYYPSTKYYILDGNPIPLPSKPDESYYWIFDFYEKKWVDFRSTEQMWDSVKLERNQRLLNSDWTQLPDVPLATKEAWAAYRQALRDITLQPDPFNIVWPQPPQ